MNLNELYEQYRKNPGENSLLEVLKESQILIYGIVFNVANHNHDAEDLTQEILIKVIHNINILPKDTNFGGWLNRVSLNMAINFYQQRQRNKTLAHKVLAMQNTENNENTEETIAIIYQHLSQLESTDKSLIMNKYIHLMTFEQLSKLYKLPKSTINSKINSILKKLKVSIEKAGFAGVAIALTSTLDQLKATEISIDLIPKIKKNFPVVYPKAKSEFFPSKILLKVAVPILAVLITFFTISYLNSSNLQSNQQSNNLIKNEKMVKAKGQAKEIVKETQKNPLIQLKENSKNEPLAIIQKPNEDLNPTLPNIDEKKVKIEKNYAGQLIDAETQKPIADAKLEIWDIYTYDKVETTTDPEGKYNIPENLDMTFFYYLKFIKEGYAVKQTFQHFEIHKNILVSMNKGKIISQTLNFARPLSGNLYRGANCNLEKELHLSINQKELLKQAFSCLQNNAPIDFYTYQKVKIENVQNYSSNETIEDGVDNYFLFSGASKQKIAKIGSDKIAFPPDDRELKLRFAATGKIAVNKELKVSGYFTKKEDLFISTDQVGTLPATSIRFFFNNTMLTIGEKCYHVVFNPYFNIRYSDNPGRRDLSTLDLFPYTTIFFEPLELSNEFHNAQAIFGGNIFSKKSLLLKSTIRVGNLEVTDQYFEKIFILKEPVISPIGGLIDINQVLTSFKNNELVKEIKKEIKLKISVNNIQLKNMEANVYFKNENHLVFGASTKIKINESGIGLIDTPPPTEKILVLFSVKDTEYSKLITLDQISGDSILLNFNKSLAVQESLASVDANLLANTITKNARERNGTSTIVPIKNQKKIVNKNTCIIFPSTTSNVFVENESEYFLIDYGFGVKTNYNFLKAVNLLVNSDTDKIVIKPVSDLDYTPYHLDIVDENGADIKNLKWFVEEYNGDTNWVNEQFLFIKEWNAHDLPDEFCRKQDGVKVTDEFLKEKTVGEQAIANKTIFLLTNRTYFLHVVAEGYLTHLEIISIKEHGQINKKVILRKSNSVKFKANNSNEFDEIVKVLKEGDFIYEYNGIRISNKNDYLKAFKNCNQEKVSIKLIRDNLPMSLLIPAFDIAGIEDNCYDDKNGYLTN